MQQQLSKACSLTDAGGAFDGLLPDALLLDSSANEVAEMIMHQLESSINSTNEEEHYAAPASWAPLLPAASGSLSPSATACFGAPLDPVHAAGPIWTNSFYALQQQQVQYAAPAAAATSDIAGHSSASGCPAAAPNASMLTFVQHSPSSAADLAGLAGTRAAGAAGAAAFLPPCLGPYTSLMQRRDSCAGGSSSMQCNSPSSTPAFSAAGFLSASDDSSMPCGDAALPAAAAAAAAAPGDAAGALAAAGNKRKAAASQASQRRVRVQKQAAADTAKEQVTAMSSKCSHQLQDKLDGMRAENSKLLGRLADITSKWQATVVENAALNAQNGDVQAQLGEMQHAVAMLQRERDELRRALQQQRPAQCQQQQMQLAMLQQQQQQQVAWTPVDHGHAHGAAAGQWAHW